MNDWRHRMYMEYRLGMAMRRPTSFTVCTPLETASAQEIMDELRETDPDAHAKLSEIVVIGDDGKVLPESLDLICAWIKTAESFRS